MPEASDIANAVRTHRIRLGMSQSDLAASASTSRTNIALFEQGRRILPQGIMDRILHALKMPTEGSGSHGTDDVPGLPRSEYIRSSLASQLAQFQSAPFLFIGSGLSRRYLGLEDWEGLLQKFCGEVGESYAYLKGRQGDGKFPEIASSLAEPFYEAWFKEGKFEESRMQYEDEVTDISSPLKIEIATYIRQAAVLSEPALAVELEALQQAVIDGIITTNWDSMLEMLFPKFKVFVGQNRLLFANPMTIGEIYKIHGCASAPNTQVLTAADYDEFSRRNPYLAAKLITIFVEHPIVFLGYSLTDRNVREMLTAIATCMDEDELQKLAQRLIFVRWDRDNEGDMISTGVIDVGSRTLTITLIRTAAFVSVYEAMKLARRFSAPVLRRLKDYVYDLVRTSDRAGRMYVATEIDGDDDLDVVFGVGAIAQFAQVGYLALGVVELFRDLVFDEHNLDAGHVVHHTLPSILKAKARNYAPIFKYLKEAGMLTAEGESIAPGIPSNVARASMERAGRLLPAAQYVKHKAHVRRLGSTEAVIAHYGAEVAAHHLALLHPDQHDLDVLQKYLTDNFQRISEGSTPHKKVACLLDLLTFAPGFADPLE
ncbi:MAG: SIR2 family protein [Myxococcota bacterium]